MGIHAHCEIVDPRERLQAIVRDLPDDGLPPVVVEALCDAEVEAVIATVDSLLAAQIMMDGLRAA